MRRITLLSLLLILATSICRAESAPNLPDGVDPLPADLNAKMKELLKNAEKYRGLKCLHGVPSGSLKEDMLRTKMRLAFEEELPPAKMRPLEAALKAFGFIPSSMDLSKYYPELLTSQVGGYYDPRRQYLVIVQREGGLLGKEAKAKLGEALASRMEETVLVHELTHALQDQHFNLRKFMLEDPLSDAAAARTALVEGDATLTMYNFFGQMKMEEMPMAEELVTKLIQDPKQLMAMTPDMPGAKEMENAPAYFRDGMLFSYMQGFIFCMNVKKLGGQALLDYAFSVDPPRSTEQIIHPEKWHTQRDDPIEITLPDFAEAAPGWTKIAEGTLGELGVRILLNESMKDAEQSAAAACGWGGDRYAVLEKNGALMLAWVTDWDTKADAAKFKSAAVTLGGDWSFSSPNDKRVTLFHSNDGDASKLMAGIQKTLADAKASVPENKHIDLAKVGLKKNKKLDVDDLTNLIGQGGKLDVDKLLNDPNIEKAIKDIGGNGGDGGVDLSGLMKSPLVKGMLKNMLSQKAPEGKLTEDGREYSNDTLGLSIKLPDALKDWKMDTHTPMPMTALGISSPDNVVQIQVATQNLPMEMPIDSMGPMLEMGIKMMLKNYKKFKDGIVGEGASKGYEIQYSGAQMGMTVRATQRVYMRGGTMLVISAIAPIDAWDKNEAGIKAALDAFKLSAPKLIAIDAPQTPPVKIGDIIKSEEREKEEIIDLIKEELKKKNKEGAK